jgi:AcrR family transcriptional regulator
MNPRVTPTAQARRGRPRSEKAKASILAAASAILEAEGLREMSVDAVAARAGVSKATIYRWWDSKADLALDTFLADARRELAPPNTGSFAKDLRARGRTISRAYGRTPLGPALAHLIGEAQADAELGVALTERVIAPLREGSREIFRRAITRGEIPKDTPIDVVIDMLVGPIYYHLLLRTGPRDNRLADAVVDLLLAALQTEAKPGQAVP